MKTRILITTICLMLAGLFSAVPALAQQGGEGKDSEHDTMNVMRPDEVPGDIERRLHVPDQATRDIELPESASEEGHDNSKYGLDTANEAREQRMESGMERRESAMERSRQSMEETRGEAAMEEARDRIGDRNLMEQRVQKHSREERNSPNKR